jgi:hypothetical protein
MRRIGKEPQEQFINVAWIVDFDGLDDCLLL